MKRFKLGGAESIGNFHGNVHGEVWVNFLALFVSKPHIFMYVWSSASFGSETREAPQVGKLHTVSRSKRQHP